MLKNYFSTLLLVLAAVFGLQASAVKGDPQVTASVMSASPNTITIRFTPNADVKEYYLCQFDHDGIETSFQSFKSMFGFKDYGDMIIAWAGKAKTGATSNTWKDLFPGTEYDFYIQALDVDGNRAPLQYFTFSTENKGGEGASVITVEPKEFSQEAGKYYQRIVCTSNDQTKVFYSQPYPDKWTDEEGVEHVFNPEDAKDYFQDLYDDPNTRTMYGCFDVDDWTWEVQYATKYHATARGMNANGEWGELTDVVFTTPGYVERDAVKFWWGYGDGENVDGYYGPSKDITRAGAIRLPDEVTASYDAAQITGIKFAVGGLEGSCTDVSYFLVKGNLEDYAQHLVPVGTLKTGWHEFEVAEPITIHKGENIYVGYQATGKRPLAYAGMTGKEGTCYIISGTKIDDYGGWEGYNYELACQIQLESNQFKPAATLNEVVDLGAETGKPVEVTCVIENTSPVALTKYTVSLQIDGKTVTQSTKKCNLDEKGASEKVTLKYNAGLALGDHPYQVSIIALNGEALEEPIVRSGVITVKDIYLTRRHVIEDCTGTWCGFCPRAAVGLELLKKAYPNDVIGIAVHGRDAYEIGAYSSTLLKIINGYPTVYINRQDVISGGEFANQEAFLKAHKQKTVEGESRIVAAQWADATKRYVDLIVSSRFAKDYASHGYGLSFVVTEDNIEANQSSYFDYGGGWVKLQDVARSLEGYSGINGSIPEQITAGETYYYRYKVAFPSKAKVENSHVIALLVKNLGNTIVNADIIDEIAAPGTYDLEGIGTVIRDTETTVAAPFDMQGRRIATPKADQIIIQNGVKRIVK